MYGKPNLMPEKMKQTLLFISTLLLATFFNSCIFIGGSVKGNGNVVEETRKTDHFEKIVVSRGMNVYLSQGEKTKIVVKADENLLDVIETRVENNTLKVTANENIRDAKSKKIYVTVPVITEIKSTAGSNVFTETPLESEVLELTSTAGSNMKLELIVDNVNVSTTAGSNIKLEGKANIFTAKSSAGSNIKAEQLSVNNCNASVNSGANIWISVNDDFEGNASSGGNIFYYGNPKSVNKKSSSGGNVIKK